jgi:hypothetical protein
VFSIIYNRYNRASPHIVRLQCRRRRNPPIQEHERAALSVAVAVPCLSCFARRVLLSYCDSFSQCTLPLRFQFIPLPTNTPTSLCYLAASPSTAAPWTCAPGTSFSPRTWTTLLQRFAIYCLRYLVCSSPERFFIQVAATLFAIPAVDALYFGPDFITVTRVRAPALASAATWERLRDEIVQHLEDFCEERQQQQLAKDAARLDSSAEFDDPTEALIVDIIETQVGLQRLAHGFCYIALTRSRFAPLCRKMAGISPSSAGTSPPALCG